MVEVPIFQGKEGEDVESYLKSFVRASRMSGWQESMWVRFVSIFLEGMALVLEFNLGFPLDEDIMLSAISHRCWNHIYPPSQPQGS